MPDPQTSKSCTATSNSGEPLDGSTESAVTDQISDEAYIHRVGRGLYAAQCASGGSGSSRRDRRCPRVDTDRHPMAVPRDLRTLLDAGAAESQCSSGVSDWHHGCVSLRASLPDQHVVAKMLELARSPWEPAALTALGKRNGWVWSGAHHGFTATGHFIVRPADPEMTDGRQRGAFFVDFCAFMPSDDDPEGDELADEWHGPPWPLRRRAERDEFDRVCCDVIDLVAGMLGPPRLAGRDADRDRRWLHALWHLDDAGRMVAVLQRDDLDLELGSVWIRDKPAGAPQPRPGEPFVDWLYR